MGKSAFAGRLVLLHQIPALDGGAIVLVVLLAGQPAQTLRGTPANQWQPGAARMPILKVWRTVHASIHWSSAPGNPSSPLWRLHPG